MNVNFKMIKKNASYRLIGVITIGKTKIPIAGFGYPETLPFETEKRAALLKLFSEHRFGMISIEKLDERNDRVTWSIPEEHNEPFDLTSPPKAKFEIFLDLPIENRNELIGTQLFTSTLPIASGFLSALTISDETHLCFYELTSSWKGQEPVSIQRFSGECSKFVSGPAVPLLRTIETLRSQIAPQRTIQIPDEELGIIYHALFPAQSGK